MIPAVFAILMAQTPTQAVQSVARKQDQFGLAALQAMAKPGENIVISPNNLLYAFAGLYPAASGESRKALEKALGVTTGTEVAQTNVLKQIFTTPGMGDEQLESAAAAWIDNEIHPTPGYVNAIKAGLDYDVRNLDLQATTSLGEINGWVKRETNDRIPSILEQMPRGALMVLTSALYYKAPWMQKMTVFDVPISFGTTGTKQQVKSMGMNGEFAYLDAPTYRALVVPFKGDGVAEFYVPKGDHTPEHIAGAALSETTAKRVERVRLRMPMWKVEYYESVKEPLQKAGLAPLFEPRDEFRPIAKDVWVLDAFHRTWVDMNENGVEAAAATAVVVGRTSAPIGEPIDFTIDRPFFVVIRKKTTGAALFMGFIHRPTAF